MSKSKATLATEAAERDAAILQLKRDFKIRPKRDGKSDAYSTIYTRCNHTARSGMYRCIDVFIIRKNQPLRITWLVAKALGDKFDERHEGIGVGGCGMDFGFALVYNLGRALWPKGTAKPHGTRNGEPDRDGGYALRHEWL
jgi:hypothetical protein